MRKLNGPHKDKGWARVPGRAKGMLNSGGFSRNFLTLRHTPLIMKLLRIGFAFLLLGLLGPAPTLSGQQFQLPESAGRSPKIRFELLNNLMVVPLEVNGTQLSFILDSGVGKPILFNLADRDSIELKNVRKLTIQGLGSGEPIEALSSVGNTFRLSSLVNRSQQVYVVLDKDLNFSPALGIPIHGIIGYDLFRDFVVEINYGRRYIRFHDPDTYKARKGKGMQTLPLDVDRKKAFLEGSVVVRDGQQMVPVRLLMDTGSSDAVWLFPDPEEGLEVPEKHYEDYLGKGLSGTIYGKRTKISQLRIGDFVLTDAKAAFPDMDSFQGIGELGERDGSLGGELLKRFNMVVNYPAGEITLSRNSHFRDPFLFNRAGIELEHAGMRYIAERIADSRGVVMESDDPFGNVQILLEGQTRLSLVPEIVVSAIRAGSPAHEVGLREGDVILAVNGKSVHKFKLQEVMGMINDKKGKRVKLLIERFNRDLLFSFVLREVFE